MPDIDDEDGVVELKGSKLMEQVLNANSSKPKGTIKKVPTKGTSPLKSDRKPFVPNNLTGNKPAKPKGSIKEGSGVSFNSEEVVDSSSLEDNFKEDNIIDSLLGGPGLEDKVKVVMRESPRGQGDNTAKPKTGFDRKPSYVEDDTTDEELTTLNENIKDLVSGGTPVVENTQEDSDPLEDPLDELDPLEDPLEG